MYKNGETLKTHHLAAHIYCTVKFFAELSIGPISQGSTQSVAVQKVQGVFIHQSLKPTLLNSVIMNKM